MSRYLAYSKSAYYGVLCALPLLAVYELVLWTYGGRTGMQVRNAADAWLRLLLESLGLGPAQATLAMMGLLIALIPALGRSDVRLEGRYLAMMLVEAVLYSVALGIVINLLLYLIVYSWLATPPGMLAAGAGSARPLLLPVAMPRGGGVLTGIALSLGAGLFEELAFRVVLLTVLLAVFGLILPRRWAAFFAIVFAALAFSLAHYAGALGEPFRLHTLMYRWLAGLLFTLLYYQRGFAIAAWSHALYDIWVLLV